MQLNYFLALGFLPELLAATKLPLRRDVSCSSSVAASTGDTCESFGQTWGLTVDQFKALNPDAQCPNLDTSKNYCVIGTVTSPTGTTTKSSTGHSPTMPGLADNCDKFHKVSSGDQCDVIEKQYGISDNQFKKWNPEINDKCTNLWLDYYVCVHVPSATTTSPGSSTPTSEPSGPTPQMPGIVDNCNSYHKVVSGDNCYNIDQKYDISLSQFLMWNTEVNDTCSNLWVDYYVCVGV
ncbi:hypothetical protein SI65_06445 [Aspergillus cristatus]|uniref:LysM domain-containing protein n=1 Tax=Aspergillus cristatus TaxID=573508 RepID=A0A1E3BC74_ASPCR|nr:hypothetical protein SI65_06445 [Aspergillus cristatus]